MQKCKHCSRERPDFMADPTCAKGGYCEWEETVIPIISVTKERTMTAMNVSWADGNGIMGRRMAWSFPDMAIVEGLEVQPYKPAGMGPGYGGDYNGFISSLRVGLVEYLQLGPYPILMWSPGMPSIYLTIPHVPYGSTFSLETDNFMGKIRPRGYILSP
jgi:hypothetical protein